MTVDPKIQNRIQQLAVDLDLENDTDPSEANEKLVEMATALSVLSNWYEGNGNEGV